MEHKEFKNKVYIYLSGELEGNDLENFEVHYFSCLSCRDYLLSLKLLFSTLREYFRSSEISEIEDILDVELILDEIKEKYQKGIKQRLTEAIEANIRKPTELERSEVEFYLSQGVDALLITLGRSTAGALGAEFSPETAKNNAEAWLDSVRGQLINKICEEWSYREKRKDDRLGDNVILATTIGNLIAPLVTEVPPLAVACLLVNMGIDEFCGDDKK
jgi:hypothetical protein